MIGCLGLISMDSWYLALLDRSPINHCFRPSTCVRLTLHFTSHSERSWRLASFITSLSFLASSSIRAVKCRLGPAAPVDHNVTKAMDPQATPREPTGFLNYPKPTQGLVNIQSTLRMCADLIGLRVSCREES